MMKTLRMTLLSMTILITSISLQSCLDDDDDYPASVRYPNALVTVKTGNADSCYFQLDDKTTLFPTNLSKHPYGKKEVRALVNFSETNENSHGYSKAVHVNWIDSILTKPAIPSLGVESDKKYGKDPVEIINDWVTIAEDGYLTLRFRSIWSTGRTHWVNLLTNVNAENPYEVEFRHNAEGDTNGRWGDALVAFNLKDLPDTQGKTVTLKLRWNSFSGEKTAEFNYCSQKGTKGSLQVENL